MPLLILLFVLIGVATPIILKNSIDTELHSSQCVVVKATQQTGQVILNSYETVNGKYLVRLKSGDKYTVVSFKEKELEVCE